jgi:hypothetical protein
VATDCPEQWKNIPRGRLLRWRTKAERSIQHSGTARGRKKERKKERKEERKKGAIGRVFNDLICAFTKSDFKSFSEDLI